MAALIHPAKFFSVFALLVLVSMQTSCGFHLRGALGLSDTITPVFIELDGAGDELRRELSSLISASGENALAASKSEAKTELTISVIRKKQRVVAVDNRGRAREYELNYKFSYELKKTSASNAQAEIIKTNTVNLKRDLLFDPDSVLAVADEKASLYEDMRKDAARVVLRQLNAIKSEDLKQSRNKEIHWF